MYPEIRPGVHAKFAQNPSARFRRFRAMAEELISDASISLADAIRCASAHISLTSRPRCGIELIGRRSLIKKTSKQTASTNIWCASAMHPRHLHTGMRAHHYQLPLYPAPSAVSSLRTSHRKRCQLSDGQLI